MSLSSDLISQFVKITNDTDKTPKDTIVYGEVVVKDGKTYVRLDGAGENVLTPISYDTISSTSAQNGDRVMVTMKNHTAVITGNLTQPVTNAQLVSNQAITVAELTSKNAVIEEKLTASEAEVAQLKADNVTITGDLNAAKADIGTLKANSLDADEINALKANITEVEAVKGRIYTLETTSLTTDKADAKYATIEKLEADYATIDSLSATNLNVQNLNAEVMDINTLMFGSATGNVIQTSFANSVVSMIGNAQIKAAMIESISAGQITAGDIITNNVKVKSEDGSLIISDETMQISDGTRVRVQIGKDAANDYSINIWDQNGNLMFSKGGITDSAIKNAIIRDDMVSETADISASKLNINSLFEEINGSTNTIKSSKVYLDDRNQTLEVAFTELSSTVTDQGELISSQGTAISTVQGQISSKIWQQDIDSIQVGGRNLIPASTFVNDNIFKNATTATFQNNGAYVTSTKSYAYCGLILHENLVSGETYTFSCRAAASSNANYGWLSVGNIENVDSNTQYFVRMNIKDEVKIVKTFTATSNLLTMSIYPYANPTAPTEAVWMYAYDIKLEKGNKATDWTPAPEDIDGAINSTETRMTTKYSELEQTLDGFKTTVSETYSTKEDLNNLSIGGRNLLAKTAFGEASEYNLWANSYGTIVKTTDGLKYTNNSDNNYNGFIFPLTQEGNLENGQEYTLSFQYRTNIAKSCALYVLQVTAPNVTITNELPLITSETVWQKFSYTFSNPYINVRTAKSLLFPYTIGAGDWFEIKDRTLKLEKGNRATDWTPAPEDIDTRMSSAETKIDQNAESITLSASKTELSDATKYSLRRKDVDLSDTSIYNTDTFYPVVGTIIPADGYKIFQVNVQLDTNSVPWSTHTIGRFSCNLTARMKGYGWGQVRLYEIGWIDDCSCNWCESDIMPAHIQQIGNYSIPVLYLRGGGLYRTYTDYDCDWTIYADGYTKGAETVSPIVLPDQPTNYEYLVNNWADHAEIKVLSDRITSTVEEVGGLKSTIEQTAESWTVQFEDHKSDVGTQIDSIQVGGRNLIAINDFESFGVTFKINSTNDISVSNVSGDATSMTTITRQYDAGTYTINGTSSLKGKSFRILFSTNNVTLPDGKTLTHNTYYANRNRPYFVDVTLPLTFTLNESGLIGILWLGGSQTITGLKLEKGNKATDWTPAPEDVDASIASAATQATNYMRLDSTGLVVGNLTASTLGNNVLIDTDSVDIRSGSTVLASYRANEILLGMNDRYNTSINLCNGGATMTCSVDELYDQDCFHINAEYLMSMYASYCIYQDVAFGDGDKDGYANFRLESHVPSDSGLNVGGRANLTVTTDESVGSIGSSAQLLMAEAGIELNYDAIDEYNDYHCQFKLYTTGEYDQRRSRIKASADDIEFSGSIYLNGQALDTGWINASIEPPFVVYSTDYSSQVMYRRVNKTVEIRGAVKPSDAISGGTDNYLIFTLPSGFRPSGQVCVVSQGSGTNSWLMSITSAGYVRFSRYNNGSGYVTAPVGAWLPFNATFLID